MKRFIISFTVGIITIITMLCGSMNANALGFYECEINIYITNAPEETAFADILFKKVEDDKYASVADPHDNERSTVCRSVCLDSGNIELDEHCGLAEYDDGFTSCMMRRYFVTTNRVYPDRCNLNWNMPSAAENDEIFEYYGEFEVAYCDREGNVLLVTDPVKVRGSYSVYEVYADGAKAKCSGKRDLAAYVPMVIFVFFIAVTALVAAVIAGIVTLLITKKSAPDGKKAVRVLSVLAAMGITAVVVGAISTVFVRFVFY